MALMPLVERIQVDKEEATLLVEESIVGLERNRRFKARRDPPPALIGCALTIVRTFPLVIERARLDRQRTGTTIGRRVQVDDAVETRIHIERKHETTNGAVFGHRTPLLRNHVVVVNRNSIKA